MKKYLAIWIFFTFVMNGAFALENKVKVGVYINDIQTLDLKSHSYSMDFYLWFKWTNPELDPSSSVELMNPADLWGHTSTKNYEKPIQLATGEYYQIMRVQGRFSHKFNLRDYPFDKQKLIISFEDNESTSKEVSYILDDSPIALNPEIVFPGFELKAPTMRVKDITHPTNFGDPTLSNKSIYNRVIIEVPIFRPILSYSVKLLVPVLCVVFCAALMFLFSPNYIESRVGIGITSILTVVALQITLGSDLPEIDYLVLIDKIYLLTYLFIVAGLFIVLKGSWDLEKDRKSIAAISALDKKALMILVATYLVLSCVIILLR